MSVARSTGKSSDRMKNIETSLAGSYDESDYAGNSKYLKTKIEHFEKKVEDGTSKPQYVKAKELLSKLEEKFPGKPTTLKKTVTAKANRSSSPKASAPKAAPKSAVDKAAAAAKAAQDKAAKAATAAAEAMKKADEAAKKAQTVAENAAKPKAAKSSTRKANKANKNGVPNIYTNMSKITHSPSGRAYGPENSLRNIYLNLEKAYIVASHAYKKSRKNKPANKNAAVSNVAPVAAPAAPAAAAALPTPLAVIPEESKSRNSSASSAATSVANTGSVLSSSNSNEDTY